MVIFTVIRISEAIRITVRTTEGIAGITDLPISAVMEAMADMEVEGGIDINYSAATRAPTGQFPEYR